MTGLANPSNCAEAARAGFDVYLLKPLDLEHLRQSLAFLCDDSPTVRGRRGPHKHLLDEGLISPTGTVAH